MNKNLIKLVMLSSISASFGACAYNAVEIMSADEYSKFADESPQDLLATKNEIASAGYQHSDTNAAHWLIDHVIKQDFDKRYFDKAYVSKYKGTEADTHMKPRLSDINTAVPYKSIAKMINGKTVGFAPAASYQNGKWTGIGEFVNSKSLGACQLVVYDLEATGGGVIFNHANMENKVNGRPGTSLATGSESTGYTYQVGWVHDAYSYDFECASLKFDKKQLDKMISAAKKIDGVGK